MSLQFSDTSTYKGLVQIYEKEIGATRGDVSGDTDRLKEFAADANMALDDFMAIAIPASGTWQFDDSNHTDNPVIFTNLVSTQRSYSWTVDQLSNLILDVFKVAILPSATATLYQEIEPFDEFDERDNPIITGDTTTAIPTGYAKLANGILLNSLPGYNATNGLKIFINREASYFAYSDTTKKPGVPGLFHRYFAVKPALRYARTNNNANMANLEREVMQLEQNIVEYFSKREKDVLHKLTPESIDYV